MTDASKPLPSRLVIAVAGPHIGHHGTALAAQLRRSATLALLTVDPPRPVPAGCQVTWDDNTSTSYPVAWLRIEPDPASAHAGPR